MKENQVIPLTYNKILQSKSYTVFILGNEEKKFAIYTSPQIGENIQVYLSEEISSRPSTHQLIQNLLKGTNASVSQVVIYDVHDTIYFSKIFIEINEDGKKKILDIDARPSDCLTLAIMNSAPIFCTKETFDKAVEVDDIQ
ncbi:MAG: bifunctional nuclease family protein [Chlamydiales bacterium]|nr:bifunctional nuclease family protein [Chlamydiales bacterium]